MVPKAQRLFVGNCLALRRQLTARRLAGCCRVDARFTLAFWTLAPWTLAFGHWSRRTLVAIGTGRFRRSSFSARDGAKNPPRSPPILQKVVATNNPDDSSRSKASGGPSTSSGPCAIFKRSGLAVGCPRVAQCMDRPALGDV